MARRLILPSLALAVMLLAAAPRDAPAQSVDLSSSMSALCMDATCQMIRFTLNVPDQGSFSGALVSAIALTSTDLTLFDFVAIEQVWNSDGTLYNNDGVLGDAWTANVNPLLGSIEIASTGGGLLAPGPINMLISFSTATPTELYKGVLTYSANGQAINNGTSVTNFSAGGQVTPEPVSIALLGTGLLGVAGAARRKRRRAGAEPESTA